MASATMARQGMKLSQWEKLDYEAELQKSVADFEGGRVEGRLNDLSSCIDEVRTPRTCLISDTRWMLRLVLTGELLGMG